MFSKIGHFDLLRELFQTIVIPPAVHEEVVERGAGRAGARESRDAGWIAVAEVPPPSAVVAALVAAFGRGEREAIALALSLDPTMILLIDELRPRRVAEQLGLIPVGSGGVLVLAKQARLISEVRPLLDGLRGHGLRIGDAVYRRVLERAGEDLDFNG